MLILLIFGGGDVSSDVVPAPLPEGSTLQVHYIDVGQADTALVLCDGKAMIPNGNTTLLEGDRVLLYTQMHISGASIFSV